MDLLSPESWMVLFSLEGLIALLTLASLEIVLGIDNVVFLAILANKLPEHQRAGARRLGLALAMLGRIALLLGIAWVMRLQTPWITIPSIPLLGLATPELELSGRDLILLGGGLFLLGKATWEIHESLEGHLRQHAQAAMEAAASYAVVIAQVLLMDLIFSLDSVITAVGMTDKVPVMIVAIVAAIGVMLLIAGGISRFVERHPTMKMLALSFLLLIGVLLVAEGLGQHINRSYIYFAMGFSLFVELLNLRLTQKLLSAKKAGPPPQKAGS
ncbi:MAG TPA: TerC family protein [Phycisphaeraceae bacterium]